MEGYTYAMPQMKNVFMLRHQVLKDLYVQQTVYFKDTIAYFKI